MLNLSLCHQARLSRDNRFDGKFFTAVLTTGIFCRPTCPARAPKAENVRYYQNAMQAQQAGFQPCKRCLPELAPKTKLPVSIAQLVIAAEAGVTLSALSEQFNLSERQIRRLFVQHLGLAPSQYLQQQKLLLARTLLRTTSLSIADICFAAGYQSIRRFNEAIKNHYQCSASALRKTVNQPNQDSITFNLSYRPPFDWPLMLSFFKMRQIPSIEQVSEQHYCRTIAFDDSQGWFSVRQHASKAELVVTLKLSNYRRLPQVITNIRRMFDLDADMTIIHQQLSVHPILAQVIAQAPGLRLPGCWDLFEFSIRAILGQQISVKAATTLANRIAAQYGCVAPDNPYQLTHLFPTEQQLMTVDFANIGLTNSRINTLINWTTFYAEQVASEQNIFKHYQSIDQFQQTLISVKGIGPWTANYLAMRGLSDPDAFPSADLGIIKALTTAQALAPNNKHIIQVAQAWRPWRSYAAIYLWHSLAL
jgi:AraC family transcriptional regulator, regulatory protein of adaptative response / DNA-3-methyladenine glycosylase II